MVLLLVLVNHRGDPLETNRHVAIFGFVYHERPNGVDKWMVASRKVPYLASSTMRGRMALTNGLLHWAGRFGYMHRIIWMHRSWMTGCFAPSTRSASRGSLPLSSLALIVLGHAIMRILIRLEAFSIASVSKGGLPHLIPKAWQIWVSGVKPSLSETLKALGKVVSR